MLGVLQVAFSGYQVAGGLRIAGELQIFFCDKGRRSPDPHIGAV